MAGKKNLNQVIIASKGQKNLDCPHLKQNRYNLFTCECPKIIKKAEQLSSNDQILKKCCGKF